MAEPLRIVVRRGEVVEAVHWVHAVAVREDEVLAVAGDPDLVTYFRSAAKPLQALPLVLARPELGDPLVAIACASHGATPIQIEAVRELLAASGSTEDELECGPQEGRPPGRVHHNCSGKHAGMLAVCRARGLPLPGYRLPEHPLQQELLELVAEAAGVPPEEIPTAPDGCGVVTFALPIAAMARTFSVLDRFEGGDRVLAAMPAALELLRGPVGADVALMEAFPGAVAKGGAEGLLCGRLPDGTGFALKAEDGAYRPLRPALGSLMTVLGHELAAFARVPLLNSRGEEVGEVVAA